MCPTLSLVLDLLSQGKRKIRELRLVFDERLLPPRKLAMVEEHHENIQVNLPPNRPVRLEIQAVGETDTQRSETIDMVYVPPPQAPAPRQVTGAAEVKPRLPRPCPVLTGKAARGRDQHRQREIPGAGIDADPVRRA